MPENEIRAYKKIISENNNLY